MFDRNDPRRNAAWQAAQQWRTRASQSPRGPLGGLKLIFTWLLFGILLIVGTVLGLFFLLIGWAMLPIVRYRMKKRLEQLRAEQARDAGGGFHSHEAHYHETHSRERRRSGEHELLEGEYEVRDEERRN
ncbi:hypothetical protein [Billgrantia kenyensis]|uniref:Uncharacterized protein n=1 Tax=Billgrantia kenyensis TaxID=321266 RepID=A0A7W0AFV1_9GAMM|nr:hypothetical protein [Halomonas kenyensis]MBA2780969.1 hypothetical protein [Halomonas kenyensis]MCG6663304.1 hypothetical protein [Halomonas kenyensis]